MNQPPGFPPLRQEPPKTGLSVTSFVLGLLGLLPCVLFLTGLPAIITGHIARARAAREPQRYGGKGFALAGLLLGYLSVTLSLLLAIVIVGFAIPKWQQERTRDAAAWPIDGGGGGGSRNPGPGGSSAQCMNNLKQIGLAARIWSNDHNEIFPPDFSAMSNELMVTTVLICPEDRGKSAASSFTNLVPAQNVSYEYLLPNAKEVESMEKVAFRCPIHGHRAMGDGSVRQSGR